MIDSTADLEYWYDNEDRPRVQRAPAPVTGGAQLSTEERYDALGNLTARSMRTARCERSPTTVSPAHREAESADIWTDPSGTPSSRGVTRYQYDNLGNLSRVVRAAGDTQNERATDYTYDALNRVRAEVQYPEWPVTGSRLVTQYGYDAAGNRTTVVDPANQTTTYTYDALSRLTAIDYQMR